MQGRLLGFDPQAVTADAEWVKHRLARAADVLPNGYCGRPPQQDCPHPNACLTCPDFQTTAEFLPVHYQQARAHPGAAGRRARPPAGNGRPQNHRTVLVNLDKIIASLQALHPKGADGMPDRVDRLREAAQARHEATLRRATERPATPGAAR